MAIPSLGVIDASQFPVLVIHSPRLRPGDGQNIIEDLDSLVFHSKPFVLVIINDDGPPQRDHQEDKARMLWLKENKNRLASVCKGIVSIIADEARRPLLEKQAAGLQAALGVRFAVAKDFSDAKTKAQSLLVQLGTVPKA